VCNNLTKSNSKYSTFCATGSFFNNERTHNAAYQDNRDRQRSKIHYSDTHGRLDILFRIVDCQEEDDTKRWWQLLGYEECDQFIEEG